MGEKTNEDVSEQRGVLERASIPASLRHAPGRRAHAQLACFVQLKVGEDTGWLTGAGKAEAASRAGDKAGVGTGAGEGVEGVRDAAGAPHTTLVALCLP